MTTPTADATPAAPPPQPAMVASATAPRRRPRPRFVWLSGLLVLTGVASFLVWWSYRQAHSITADAFIEAHIVNIAPQTVSGHIVRFPAEENDRVKEGDVLVELDPKPPWNTVSTQRGLATS
jgi:multidrug resistance efflux pump